MGNAEESRGEFYNSLPAKFAVNYWKLRDTLTSLVLQLVNEFELLKWKTFRVAETTRMIRTVECRIKYLYLQHRVIQGLWSLEGL